MGEVRVSQFAVERIKDNRLQGLLREIEETIHDMDEPEGLRSFGRSLKMLSDAARGKGVAHGGRFY